MPQTNDKGKRFLIYYLVLCLVADFLWAATVATLGATILNEVGHAAGASDGGTMLATVLTWVVYFVIAALQGAVFLIVASVFLGLILMFFFGKSKRAADQSSPDPSTQDGPTAGA